MNTIESIKDAFKNEEIVRIPLMNKGSFKAELSEEGIYVSNLGAMPMIHWDVFAETVDFLKANGGRAAKGNAMDYRLGEKCLPFDSIEGHIAHKLYNKKIGDSVFRRITPIASILSWAGICENTRGFLSLKQIES